jgi:hypothetical protein
VRRARRAAFRPVNVTVPEKTPARDCVERLRDELAVVLGNAELLVNCTDGPARERLTMLLRGAQAAALSVEELGRLLD